MDRMTDLPSQTRLIAAIEATWPPAALEIRDGWCLRRGDGGGRRASAASPVIDGEGDIATAAAAMRALGQEPLFRSTPLEPLTDAALAAAGYALHEPVVLYAGTIATLRDALDETARVIRISTPVGLLHEIWAAGGIGPGRLQVMARVRGPRTALMVRLSDRPVAAAFVACDGPVAMIHAIEVLSSRRREGAGAMLVRGGANWAAEQGAQTLGLAVSETNLAARALYEKLGMHAAGQYHYRLSPD
jgi:ribosomal protein S18 acetylase RimI-like enzyme